MGSEEMNKVFSSGKRQGKMLSAIGILCLIAYFSLIDEELLEIPVFEGNASSTTRPKPPSPNQCPDILKSIAQPKATSWTTKPVWFNMYTDTISDGVHASFINPLTNTPAGAKSYYVSRPGGKLRHCMGDTQTVSCANIHPAVEFKENQLDEKLKTFHEKYILMLRNPMTVFPATVDAKNRKYRNMVGQTPEDGWKKTRDEWFEGMCTGWKAVITAWRSTKYDVGMYLVYEDIFSFNEGPQTLLNLGHFLQEVGFSIPALENTDTNSSDIDRMHCLWYNINPESMEQKKEEEYRDMILFDSFPDYIPTYTQKQKEYLLSEMDSMINEFEDDKALVEILVRYRKDIEKNMSLDS